VISNLKCCLLLIAFITLSANGTPPCDDIFLDPPEGNRPQLNEPTGMPKYGFLNCIQVKVRGRRHTECNGMGNSFSAMDYNFTSGNFDKSNVVIKDVTTRLYFDSLTLKNSTFNAGGYPENLIIYVRNNLTLKGSNYINGLVYLAEGVTVSGGSPISIFGGLASAGSLPVSAKKVTVDKIGIENADFGGMTCETPEPPAINHYRIKFSSDALSCTEKTITIKSCANADCSALSSVTSSVALTKDGVKYSDVSITGETDTQLWHGEGGVTTVGLSPAATYRCFIDGTEKTDLNECKLTFAEAGFIFNIDNYLANKPQEKIEIFAVKKSENSTQCVSAFGTTSTRDVNFWSKYVSPTPANIVTGKSVSVNSIDISNGASLPLVFDSKGKAEFELNYADAGKIAIHAQYTAPADKDDEGLVMEGSDNTVRYPVGLCIKPETVCSAGDKTCPKFKVAGEAFDMSIQAMAWQKDSDTDYCDNPTTPNYVQDEIVLGHALKQPMDGVLGELGLSEYDHKAKADSLNALEQSIGEVGVFSLMATPPNGYLGENINIPPAESQPVGRFYPNDFEVYDESMIAACGAGVAAFSYMDEPVPLMMKIRARNLSGVTTQNYYGDFGSGTALLVGENSNAGVDYQARLTGLTALSWDKDDQGVQAVNSDIQFTRLIERNLDGPYASMAIGLIMSDNDGVLIASPDMNAGTADDCSISNSCKAKQITTQHYRHGRIVLENAYGPETDALRMPVTAEYWNGTQWAVNTLDSCTRVTEPELPVMGLVYTPALVQTQQVTRTNGAGTILDTDFAQGRFELLWQSLVATPNRYRGQVTGPLAVPTWLQWYWNWDNDGALSDPRASAFFGTYRGHDKVIYWREVN